MINLEKVSFNRAFIIGNVCGDYYKLIDILYEQKFNNNDLLIATGDFTQSDNLKSIDTLLFFMNNENTVGLLGKNGFDLLQLLREQKLAELPLWVKNYPNIQEIETYLINLPTIIQLDDSHYIVNRGIEPGKDIKSQNPEVFYTITNYDKDSRYYQGNYGEYSWYELEQHDEIIFSGLDAGRVEVNAGYCLYSDMEKDKPLKCLIYDKSTDSFIIVESIGNLLNGNPIAKEAAMEDLPGYIKFDTEDLPQKPVNFDINKYKKPVVKKPIRKAPPKIKPRDINKDMQNIIDNAGVGLGYPAPTSRVITRKKTPYETTSPKIKPVDDETQRIIDDSRELMEQTKKQPKIKEKIKFPEQQKIINEQKELLEKTKGIPQTSPDNSEIEEVTPKLIAPEADIQDVDLGEGVKPEVIVKDVNNESAKFYHYKYEHQIDSDKKVDISVITLGVYKSMGFLSANWVLNETHTVKDKCDALVGEWSIDKFIDEAKSFTGHLPAAIFTQSHPGCVCKLVLNPPQSIDQIPDNAPGLPMNVSPEVLIQYKTNLLSYIRSQHNNPVVYARTIPPTSEYVHAFMMNALDRTKIASTDNWIEDIKPMQIIEDTIVDTGYGTRLPMDAGDIGFILKYTDEKAQIYSYHYHGLFTIPIKAVKVLDLKKSDKEPTKGQFVLTDDDMIGLLYKIDAEDNIIVYFPELDITTTVVNKIQMLEFF